MKPYPKPKDTGGRLIREVIRACRTEGLKLPLTPPITSHIHIAISAGSDSLALAHLLVHYGRRVVPRSKIRLVHINHGWRGKASDGDEALVRKLASKWKVPLKVFKLKKLPNRGESPEAQARTERAQIYSKISKKGLVFTAHHADDLAETLVWRIFSGDFETHREGIRFRHDCQIRPLLAVRKCVLQAYLKEEGQAWREDRTNHEGRLLRSRMRLKLLPEIEALFPRAVENLARLSRSQEIAILELSSSVLSSRKLKRRVRSGPSVKRPSKIDV